MSLRQILKPGLSRTRFSEISTPEARATRNRDPGDAESEGLGRSEVEAVVLEASEISQGVWVGDVEAVAVADNTELEGTGLDVPSESGVTVGTVIDGTTEPVGICDPIADLVRGGMVAKKKRQ